MVWEEVWGFKPISQPHKVSDCLGSQRNAVLEFLATYDPEVLDPKPLFHLIECYALLDEKNGVFEPAIRRIESFRKEDGSYKRPQIQVPEDPLYSAFGFKAVISPPPLEDTYFSMRAIKALNKRLPRNKVKEFILSKHEDSTSTSERLFMFTSLLGLLNHDFAQNGDLFDEINSFQTPGYLYSSRPGCQEDLYSIFYCLSSFAISGTLKSVDVEWPAAYCSIWAKKSDQAFPYLHTLSCLDLLGNRIPDSLSSKLTKGWTPSHISPLNKLEDQYFRLSALYLL